MKNLLLIALLLGALDGFAQDNFTYSPQKPQPGEEISFQYTQGGDISGIMKMPEAYALVYSSGGDKIIDIPLTREYGKLVGKVKTDTGAGLVAFAFKIDDRFDNNDNNGFYVKLYEGEEVKKGSYAYLAHMYHSFGPQFLGLKAAPEKAVANYEKEFAADPAAKEKYLLNYLIAKRGVNREKGIAAIQTEIENTFRNGLKKKEDYSKLGSLYGAAGLRQQQAFIAGLLKEKFPAEEGPDSFVEKFNATKELSGKKQIIDDALAAAAKSGNKEKYTGSNGYISYMQSNLLNGLASAKDWEGFKNIAATVSDKGVLARAYNSAAWKMQEAGEELKYAETFASFATNYAKEQWKNPSNPKPNLLTARQWEQSRKSNYATYADTYAMVLYKSGNAKKGIQYAKEAALDIKEGKDAEYNNTYALLAEKVLSASKLKSLLENFVKEGNSTEAMREMLKTQFIKRKKSAEGFDQYLAALEKEAHAKMMTELATQILNKPAPQFSLTDLDGKKVNIADYKGKVVILDFWATWCGPCIASFPGMKKMQEKYQQNPDVKFLFVNTWQTEDNKEKNARDFVTKSNYDIFHVLMDKEDKVVKDFEVSGIPTKFIIGKDGLIKFKSVGFGGEEHLYKELPAMIELAD